LTTDYEKIFDLSTFHRPFSPYYVQWECGWKIVEHGLNDSDSLWLQVQTCYTQLVVRCKIHSLFAKGNMVFITLWRQVLKQLNGHALAKRYIQLIKRILMAKITYNDQNSFCHKKFFFMINQEISEEKKMTSLKIMYI